MRCVFLVLSATISMKAAQGALLLNLLIFRIHGKPSRNLQQQLHLHQLYLYQLRLQRRLHYGQLHL